MEKTKRQSIGLMVIATAFVLCLGSIGVILSMGNTYAAPEMVCPLEFDLNADSSAPANQACRMDAMEDFQCPNGESKNSNGDCVTDKVDLPVCPDLDNTAFNDFIRYDTESNQCIYYDDDPGASALACPPTGWTNDATHPNEKCIAPATALPTTSQCRFGYSESISDSTKCAGEPSVKGYVCPHGSEGGDQCYSPLVEQNSSDYCWNGGCSSSTPEPITPPKPEPTPTNPQTGDLPVIVICVIALAALGYGAYKFRSVDSF